MSTDRLRRLTREQVLQWAAGRTGQADCDVDTILDAVRTEGDAALRRYAERLDGLSRSDDLVAGRPALEAALAAQPAEVRGVLERTAARIRRFAEAQRASLRRLDTAVPGGRAGHDVVPVDVAGCYAPGGRYPLPSTVLMTVTVARTAGVREVWLATPAPEPIMLAAAAVAGADAVLRAGGAQAVAALAFGTASVPACDAIVGPGNRWVTEAKRRVAGQVRIDTLAGPSELLVVADDTADPDLIAADLLAQAEHDDDAVPMLAATGEDVVRAVEVRLDARLATLPTATTARRALENGFAVVAPADELVPVVDAVAPEHLEILTADAATWRERVRHAGAVFLGPAGAEVLGDYGVGPNHTLPTTGAARAAGGLSVLTFLRVRTWIDLDELPTELLDDVTALARLEGLEGHARSAEARAKKLQRPDESERVGR